jgi:hypothetical protein
LKYCLIFILTEENDFQKLLELSDEYCMLSLKVLIEKSLIEQVSIMFSRKAYGKSISTRLDTLIDMLNISQMYQLKKLKLECVNSVALNFTYKQLNENQNFSNLIDVQLRLEIFMKKSQHLEMKLSENQALIKQFKDENVRLKFQVKSFQSSFDQNLDE